jgi:hypothetical protein
MLNSFEIEGISQNPLAQAEKTTKKSDIHPLLGMEEERTLFSRADFSVCVDVFRNLNPLNLHFSHFFYYYPSFFIIYVPYIYFLFTNLKL